MIKSLKIGNKADSLIIFFERFEHFGLRIKKGFFAVDFFSSNSRFLHPPGPDRARTFPHRILVLPFSPRF